jgi:LPXTG-motif cell wall-anchored protein
MSATASPTRPGTETYWPRWASGLLVATGVVVVIVETTSFLVIAGLLLVGAGIYGLVRRHPSGFSG